MYVCLWEVSIDLIDLLYAQSRLIIHGRAINMYGRFMLRSVNIDQCRTSDNNFIFPLLCATREDGH